MAKLAPPARLSMTISKTSVVSISVLSDEIHNSEGDYKGLSDKDIWFGKVLPKMTEAFETIIKVVTE